ncbi:hypothetical protein ACLESO_03685 [Pyxidicoccus sp. 3LG]
MHRTSLRLLLLPLVLLASLPASAETYNVLVKSRQNMYVQAPAGFDFIGGTCRTTHFSQRTPAPNAAPGELPHTADPRFDYACQYPDPGAAKFFRMHFGFETRSIRDVGTYTIVCDDLITTRINWNACTSGGPCGIACLGDGSGGAATVVTFTLHVYNNAPTAGITVSGLGLRPDGTAQWNAQLTLHSNGHDVDGPIARTTWRVVSAPPAARAVLSGTGLPQAAITFTGEQDFGTWVFAVDVDDQQGERVTVTLPVRVTNTAPAPVISGPSTVTVNSPVVLSIDPNDVDGGMYTQYRWEALRPGGSTWEVLPNGPTPQRLEFPTTRAALGEWRFRVAVRDNDAENPDGTSPEHRVTVRNALPEVSVTGEHLVPLGAPVLLTSTAVDPDGGGVTYDWELLQAPASSGALPRRGFATSANLTLFTDTPGTAGTWVFQLHVTDEEGGTTDAMPFDVVVDAPPTVEISGASSRVEPGFTLTSTSQDPDSPCPERADRCHRVAAGRTPVVSGGVLHHTWYVDAVPYELRLFYPPGLVANAFPGVNGFSPSLTFTPGQIPAGIYRFRLQVRDAEGSIGEDSVTVEVVPGNGAPVAVLGPPRRYYPDATGRLTEPVVVSGAASVDLDNILSGGSSTACERGICIYDWVAEGPPGCPATTAVSGPGLHSLILFPAGAAVPASCLGPWTVSLVVMDDDMPALTGGTTTQLFLGSCAGDICIDSPTQARPRVVSSASSLRVPITYHVDPSVYVRPELEYGFYARIEVLRAGTTEVIYTGFDSNPAFAAPGEVLAFDWNGRKTDLTLAPPGSYDLRITLVDTNFTPVVGTLQRLAILYEPVSLTVGPTSDGFVRHAALVASSDTVDVTYTVTGAIGLDRIRYTVRGAAVGSPVAADVSRATTATSGALSWNGRSGTLVQNPGAMSSPSWPMRAPGCWRRPTTPSPCTGWGWGP